MSKWDPNDPFADLPAAGSSGDPFADLPTVKQPAANFSEDYGATDASATKGLHYAPPRLENRQNTKNLNTPEHINSRLQFFREQWGLDENDPALAPYVDEKTEEKYQESLKKNFRTDPRARAAYQMRQTFINNARTKEFEDMDMSRYGRRVVQGMTLGLSDDAVAAAQGLFTDKTWDEAYREQQQQVADDRRITGTTGDLLEFGGGLVVPGAVGAKVAAKAIGTGTSTAGKIAASTGRAAMTTGPMGAAAGYGYDDEKTLSSPAIGFALGTAFGVPGSLSQGAQAGWRGTQGIRDAVTTWMDNVADNAARSSGQVMKINKRLQKQAIGEIADELERGGVFTARDFIRKLESHGLEIDDYTANTLMAQMPELEQLLAKSVKSAGNPMITGTHGKPVPLARQAEEDLMGMYHRHSMGFDPDIQAQDALVNEIRANRGNWNLDDEIQNELTGQSLLGSRMDRRVKAGGNAPVTGLMAQLRHNKDLRNWYREVREKGQAPGITGKTDWPLLPDDYAKEMERRTSLIQSRNSANQGLKNLRAQRTTAQRQLTRASARYQAADRGTRTALREEVRAAQRNLREFDDAVNAAVEERDALSARVARLGPEPTQLTDDNVPVFVIDALRKIESEMTQSGKAVDRAVAANLMAGIGKGRGSPTASGIHNDMQEIHRSKTRIEDLQRGASFGEGNEVARATDVAEFRNMPNARKENVRAGTIHKAADMVDRVGRMDDAGEKKAFSQSFKKLFGTERDRLRYNERVGPDEVNAETIVGSLQNIRDRRRVASDMYAAMGLKPDEVQVAGVIADTMRRAYFSPGYAAAHVLSSAKNIKPTARNVAIARYLLNTTEEGRRLVIKEMNRRRYMRYRYPEMQKKFSLAADVVKNAVALDLIGGSQLTRSAIEGRESE